MRRSHAIPAFSASLNRIGAQNPPTSRLAAMSRAKEIFGSAKG